MSKQLFILLTVALILLSSSCRDPNEDRSGHGKKWQKMDVEKQQGELNLAEFFIKTMKNHEPQYQALGFPDLQHASLVPHHSTCGKTFPLIDLKMVQKARISNDEIVKEIIAQNKSFSELEVKEKPLPELTELVAERGALKKKQEMYFQISNPIATSLAQYRDIVVCNSGKVIQHVFQAKMSHNGKVQGIEVVPASNWKKQKRKVCL